MDLRSTTLLCFMFQPSLSALLAVEAERNSYQSEFRGDVVMGCRFRPEPSDPDTELKVTWRRIAAGSDRDVYVMDEGVERAASPEYQGRVRLLKEELREGRVKLKLSNLRINDSGTYQCLVQTANGADNKTITLDVIDKKPAPRVNNKVLYILLGAGMFVIVTMAAIFIYRHRGGRDPPGASQERRTPVATHVLWRKGT